MQRAGIYKGLMVAAAFTVPFLAVAQVQLPSLKHGVYVREPEPCKGAPNAAVMSWDGSAFSGPHSSKCMSRVVRKDGQKFRISTSCSAIGDGSANPSGKPDVEAFVLTRLSDTKFEMVKDSQAQGTYRWCSAKDVD